ncbi:B-cell antigen receptor complex-associated protein beta chain isoform X3 [Tympanuchus pallidicinctus]|uniref:B-cell antigen receptor complex-associated protein beta chain isoform X3 n=1 Tax=Tympanuchus pallidicinctus TaxID=109042 RepID=UPI0022874C8D|nr:B-cell antigen receptor complex-associated protein beta chain isoform X3 [Tympanuchus pallidicinctus]
MGLSHKGLFVLPGFVLQGLILHGVVLYGFVLRGFVLHGFALHRLVQSVFVPHEFVLHGFVLRRFVLHGFVLHRFVLHGFVLHGPLSTLSGPFSYPTGGIPTDGNSTSNSTGSGCFGLWQHPRYMAAKKNTPVHFICYTRQPHAMQWYKAPADGEEFQALDQSSDRFSIKSTNDYINFTIFRISYEDNGIYVCDSKNLTEEKRQPYLCGTELRVMSRSNIQQIQNRNTLKDTIIIIQTILLVIFISVPMLLFLEKGDGKESPEEDHTYEGLEVEQIATYEDITPFRDMKAKWTVGEHPGEE